MKGVILLSVVVLAACVYAGVPGVEENKEGKVESIADAGTVGQKAGDEDDLNTAEFFIGGFGRGFGGYGGGWGWGGGRRFYGGYGGYGGYGRRRFGGYGGGWGWGR